MVKEILPEIFNEYFIQIIHYQKELQANRFCDEDLHQLRINLRKVISLIDFFQEYFPPKKIKEKRKFFKSLIDFTNKKRDLDVFNMTLHIQSKRIKKNMLINLSDMIDIVKANIDEQKGLIIKEFGDKRNIDKLKDFIHFFEKKKNYLQSLDKKMLQKVIQLKIDRYLKLIDKDIKQLKRGSHSKEYHKVRIKVKKVRYLCEMYYSLYPSKEIKKTIVTIKKIQSLFGEYQDCYMHQQLLFHLFGESFTNIVKLLNQEFILKQYSVEENIIEACSNFRKSKISLSFKL